uniref:Uncharacterized protein n=1 Tax=Anopheles funestus TaxID=62324 RepID=A0A182R7N2_ANOFN
MDVSLENLSSSQKDELMSTIKQKIENDGKMFQKMCRQAWPRLGRIGTEMYRYVYGQVYGLLECGFESINSAPTAGTVQRIMHITTIETPRF